MYESIPEYRVKQERTAQKYAAERLHVCLHLKEINSFEIHRVAILIN